MFQERCRLTKAERKILYSTRAAPSTAYRSKASSRSKRALNAHKADLVTRWWERPEFAKCFVVCDKDPPCESCKKHNEHQLQLLRARRKFPRFKHVLTDFSHGFAKLKVPWDDLPQANKPRPRGRGRVQFYHGIKASDVTAHLERRPPRRDSTDPESATEWFGLKSCDVTRHVSAASKGRRPPSWDYHYRIQATHITILTRKVVPAAPSANDDEPREFFGKPKTDVTDFDILPKIIPNETCRNDTLHPLGKSRIPIPYRYHTVQYSAEEEDGFSKAPDSSCCKI